jgi:glycosyltransferase involved in cell wall biosynthesis
MMRRLPEKLAARSRVRLLTISDDPQPRVNYGRTRLPAPGHPIGGEIKLIHLRKAFPEALDEFNLIYLVSSALPPHAEELVDVAKRRGAKLVWNQNGVAYPGFYGDSYPWFNRRLAALRSRADYIVNQSEFSRISAERYLGASEVPSEVLFNPVDTSLFAPAQAPCHRDLGVS